MISKLRAAVEAVASNLRESVVYDFPNGSENTLRRVFLEALLALEIALAEEAQAPAAAPAAKASRFVLVVETYNFETPVVEVYSLDGSFVRGKIAAIKFLRGIENLSLLEAKNLVDGLPRVSVSIDPVQAPAG